MIELYVDAGCSLDMVMKAYLLQPLIENNFPAAEFRQLMHCVQRLRCGYFSP